MIYVFDMGGVVTSTAQVEEHLEKILGITHSQFLEYSGAEKSYGENLMLQCSDGKISCKEFWEKFSENSGLTIKTDWWHYLFHPVRNNETYALIEKLKEKGNRVICGTNTIDAHWKNHMERGDYNVFDQTYASCFMGVSKPDAAFWQIIMEAEKAEPSQCIFIDDKLENCQAAQRLGIKSIQFTDALTLAKQLNVSLAQEDESYWL